MNKKNIAFTIIAQNYLPYAVTLANSMKDSNPDVEFIIVFADDLNGEIRTYLEANNITGISIFELCVNDVILDMAFYYEVTEYCTAIKPFVINELSKKSYETITYIDPDIYVYKSLQQPIFELLKDNNIVLTPHICSPINDNFKPDEMVHLKSGTYNLGFISIKNNNINQEFINWWMKKCELECFNDSYSGLFVDQKWINLVPGMFVGVYITRNLGLNIAYWNLHERIIIKNKINGHDDLIFFHFSGFVKNDIECVSKYQNRFKLSNRNDLIEYFENYKSKLETVHNDISVLPKYKFSNYSSGKFISLLARRFYYWRRDVLENPFLSKDSENSFLEALISDGIKEEIINQGISNPDTINTYARLINKTLSILQRIIGPNRYASLCKYFAYLSSLDNQRFLLRSEINKNVIENDRKHIKR